MQLNLQPDTIMRSVILTLCMLAVVSSASGGEPVRGNVSGLWEGTYIIDSTVTIGPNDTLYIKPGSHLIMRKPTSQLIVHGVLIAEGSRQNPIDIGVQESEGMVGPFWKGITFAEGSESYLRYCALRHGRYPVMSTGGTVTLVDCLLRDNTVGVYCAGGTVYVIGCILDKSTGVAAYADDWGAIELDRCRIQENKIGMVCAGHGRLFVEDCQVNRNGHGVLARRGAYLILVKSPITDNEFGFVYETDELVTGGGDIRRNRVNAQMRTRKELSTLLADHAPQVAPRGRRSREKEPPGEPTGERAAISTSARRLTSGKRSVSLGGVYQNWSKSTDTRTEYRQVSSPLNVHLPLMQNLKLLAGITFADMAGPQSGSALRGVNDLRVQAMYLALSQRLLLMLGGNIPTGKTELADLEFETISALADEDLLFNVKQLGEGPGVNAAVAFSDTLAKGLRYAAGAGYYFRGRYDRLQSQPSEYDPGDVVSVSGGLDLQSAAHLFRIDLNFNYFTPDRENDERTFQKGPVLGLKGTYMTGLKGLQMQVRAYDLVNTRDSHSQDGELVKEEKNSYGNRGGGDVALKYGFTDRFCGGLVIDLEAANANEYGVSSPLHRGKKLLAGIGGTAEFAPVSLLWLDLGARYYRGSIGPNFALVGGTEIRGIEIELGTTFRF